MIETADLEVALAVDDEMLPLPAEWQFMPEEGLTACGLCVMMC